MPLRASLAVVLIDVGSTKKLSVSYVATHVMPVVQQHRLSRRVGQRQRHDPPDPTDAMTTVAPRYAFRETSLFARTHVCGFAQHEPVLQHESWSAAWSLRVGALTSSSPSSSRDVPMMNVQTPRLFGPSPGPSPPITVSLANVAASPLRATVVTSGLEEVHLITLRVPPRFALESFLIDPFIPCHVQIQEGARHVVQASRSSRSSFFNAVGGDLTVLAMVCADHDVDSYASFMDIAAQEAASTRQNGSAGSNETVCTALLFDATHGLRHRCIL